MITIIGKFFSENLWTLKMLQPEKFDFTFNINNALWGALFGFGFISYKKCIRNIFNASEDLITCSVKEHNKSQSHYCIIVS